MSTSLIPIPNQFHVLILSSLNYRFLLLRLLLLSSRSSSALNLALSQAASNAYINVHLAATAAVGATPAGRKCLGTACHLQHPGIR